jgi:integrase
MLEPILTVIGARKLRDLTAADVRQASPAAPPNPLTLDQAVAVITAARTLPVMELRPGLKDVRRPAELMHAYIVLSLLAGIRTEEARALRWQHVNLDGDPAARPPVPPHVAVWRAVRVHGDTKTERSRRTLALPAAAVQALWTSSSQKPNLRASPDNSRPARASRRPLVTHRTHSAASHGHPAEPAGHHPT